MGIFSKAIPERKWVDVSAALHTTMRKYREEWYRTFADHVFPLGVGLKHSELDQEMEHMVSLLQFAVAATTVRENGYVKLKDWDLFLDLICLPITSKKVEELGRLALDIVAEPNAKIATRKWALAALPLIAETKHNQKLAELLAQWAALLVVKSKIQTCEACFDSKGANAVRALLRH